MIQDPIQPLFGFHLIPIQNMSSIRAFDCITRFNAPSQTCSHPSLFSQDHTPIGVEYWFNNTPNHHSSTSSNSPNYAFACQSCFKTHSKHTKYTAKHVASHDNDDPAQKSTTHHGNGTYHDCECLFETESTSHCTLFEHSVTTHIVIKITKDKTHGFCPLLIAYKPHTAVNAPYAINRKYIKSRNATFADFIHLNTCTSHADISHTRGNRIWFLITSFMDTKPSLLVMIALSCGIIWLFIKSLIKSTRLFVISFIEIKACLLVLIAWSFRTTSALSIHTLDHHTCALQTTLLGFNGLKCWGKGTYGRLGNENTANIGDGPNQMGAMLPNIDTGINITDIIQVQTGRQHTCLLTSTGKAKCWGSNDYGLLGYGNAPADRKGNAPNTMGTHLPFIDFGGSWLGIQITVGGFHSCVLLNNGTLNVTKCWGLGHSGVLGNGGTDSIGNEANEMGDDLLPIDFGTDFDPIQINAGHSSTCALSSSNKVKCWGSNAAGQLGIGEIAGARGSGAGQMGDNLPFTELGTGFVPIQIAVGGLHACAMSDLGKVKCFGDGRFGKLGYGNTNYIGEDSNQMGDSLPIVDLGSGLTAIQITTGMWHNCALFSIGNIKCWGYGDYGGLGYENTTNVGDSPGQMGNSLPFVDLGTGYAGTVVAVQAGDQHTCATFSSEDIKCWGRSNDGELGYGNTYEFGDRPNTMGDSLPIVDLGFQTSSPSMPSVSPTSIPTNPPSNPTRYPTSSPTSPTNPTNISTAQSTNPTSNPSKYPSSTPLKYPTSSSSNPTVSPSDDPTVFQTISPTTKEDETFNSNVWMFVAIAFVCCVTVALCAFNYVRKKRKGVDDQTMIHGDAIRDADKAIDDEKKDTQHEDMVKVVPLMTKRKMHKPGENNEDLVKSWLTATVGLPQYHATFIDNGYTSLDFVSNIAIKEDLSDIGIKIKGHQTQLMAHIQKLKEAADEALYEEPPMIHEKEGVKQNTTITPVLRTNLPPTQGNTTRSEDTSGLYDA